MTDEPMPVTITGPVPVPVTMVSSVSGQRGASSLPLLTPREQDSDDLIRAGQRRINQIWELTQAAVTVLITGSAIYCAVNGIDSDIINFAFVAIVSTYYARTNHTKIGGVKYEGR